MEKYVSCELRSSGTGLIEFADIELTSLVTNLDNTASEIVTYQRDSTVQRKDLAQKTKDFRKLDDSAKLGEFKGLLKGMRQSLTWKIIELIMACSIPDIH